MSRARYLQKLLDELRERERLSKLHNRELLQQFDEAQNTLREVLDHTAVMKMLWREYKSCAGSCPHCHHLLNQKIHTTEENKNPVTHSQGPENVLGKPETYHDLSIPLELAYSSKSSSLHSSSPNQTKQPSSETSGEDISNPEDLDVKPVRLSSALTGSEASSRVSMQRSTPKRKGNQISSDDDSFTSHKFSPKDVATGALTMASISDHNNAQTFHNKKINVRHVLGSKNTQLNDASSASSKGSHESDVEECSDKLSAHDEPQGSVLNKVAIQKENEQIASDQSSSQGENDQSDVNGEESSQEDDSEILTKADSESSLEEGDENRTSESGSSAGSESECDDVEDRPVSSAEDTDSEDCIVSPKTRSNITHVIPEHIGQTEESKQTSTDEDSKSSSEEEDIEDVLAPQDKTEKKREAKTDEKSKGPESETLTKHSVKNREIHHHSDSNESDFYD